ncbi:gastrotropin isoform X6 [Dromaius novaehollandiae]|nr:gastrotropin isoform X3 [Dromaius novaehollandiae]XP_025974397.1 gastrotropin isoform X3 [Dromaius novaehollandiae]XP_025974398.1 gastrotropin isoform X3 [Dromaius novaehollandiae]XP_025974399.1 gastrotropin isoform X3 [Dromaius novaehollandiae]
MDSMYHLWLKSDLGIILEFPTLFSSVSSPARMKHCLEESCGVFLSTVRSIFQGLCGISTPVTLSPAALLLYQPYHQGNMAFTGKYEVESDENYDDFMKKIGIPSDIIEKGRNFKIVSEVVQNGDEFTWSQHYPGGHSMNNKFTIGKEADLEAVGGKKFKATVKMEDGKIVADFPNYHHTAEISGGKLVEISTAGGVTYKRISKRIA